MFKRAVNPGGILKDELDMRDTFRGHSHDPAVDPLVAAGWLGLAPPSILLAGVEAIQLGQGDIHFRDVIERPSATLEYFIVRQERR